MFVWNGLTEKVECIPELDSDEYTCYAPDEGPFHKLLHTERTIYNHQDEYFVWETDGVYVMLRGEFLTIPDAFTTFVNGFVLNQTTYDEQMQEIKTELLAMLDLDLKKKSSKKQSADQGAKQGGKKKKVDRDAPKPLKKRKLTCTADAAETLGDDAPAGPGAGEALVVDAGSSGLGALVGDNASPGGHAEALIADKTPAVPPDLLTDATRKDTESILQEIISRMLTDKLNSIHTGSQWFRDLTAVNTIEFGSPCKQIRCPLFSRLVEQFSARDDRTLEKHELWHKPVALFKWLTHGEARGYTHAALVCYECDSKTAETMRDHPLGGQGGRMTLQSGPQKDLFVLGLLLQKDGACDALKASIELPDATRFLALGMARLQVGGL